jgi:hypothetical protein
LQKPKPDLIEIKFKLFAALTRHRLSFCPCPSILASPTLLMLPATVPLSAANYKAAASLPEAGLGGEGDGLTRMTMQAFKFLIFQGQWTSSGLLAKLSVVLGGNWRRPRAYRLGGAAVRLARNASGGKTGSQGDVGGGKKDSSLFEERPVFYK